MLREFLVIEWPAALEYTDSALLTFLLQLDENCELTRKVIDQIDIQKTFSIQLNID